VAIPQISLWQGVRTVVSQKYFWPVALWFFFDCGIFFGFGSLWSGPYLSHTYGLSKVETGAVLSTIAWGMVLGGPLLGMLSQRVLRSRKKTFVLCTSALVVLLLALTLFPAGLSRTALVVWFFLFSVCSSAIVIMGFTTTKELFPVEIAGTCVGMVNFFPFFGGAVFMPLLGQVLDAWEKRRGPIRSSLSHWSCSCSWSPPSCRWRAFLMKTTYRNDKACHPRATGDLSARRDLPAQPSFSRLHLRSGSNLVKSQPSTFFDHLKPMRLRSLILCMWSPKKRPGAAGPSRRLGRRRAPILEHAAGVLDLRPEWVRQPAHHASLWKISPVEITIVSRLTNFAGTAWPSGISTSRHTFVAVGLGADLERQRLLFGRHLRAQVQWKWIRALLAVSKTGSVMKPGTPNA
jgi:hypothetical protein